MGKKNRPGRSQNGPTFYPLRGVKVVSQQFVNVMNTYTNHNEVPRTFKMLKHVAALPWLGRTSSALYRNLRTFGNTLMLPMRRLGLWSFCINRYGSLIRGSRSKIRALARPTSKVTNAEHGYHI